MTMEAESERLRPMRSATNPKSTPPAAEATSVTEASHPPASFPIPRSRISDASTIAYSVTSKESSIHPTPPASRELRSAALTSCGHSSPRILLVGRSAAIWTLFTPLASILKLFVPSSPASLAGARARFYARVAPVAQNSARQLPRHARQPLPCGVAVRLRVRSHHDKRIVALAVRPALLLEGRRYNGSATTLLKNLHRPLQTRQHNRLIAHPSNNAGVPAL